ncbi:2-oxoglutarate and iron-dependent oxygenase JMJD4 isoform X2 [Hyalella azteca]|uniref:Jumonji domain-containing protein 4 n=2 Tax=Hyalella azteca TaxID=294128 RepID=A0A979FJY3_HYAAZ|nr:2-oxoglutarate and iron-dependent oxygenase JMJD4 isoform X2 [Hyalella azteca]
MGSSKDLGLAEVPVADCDQKHYNSQQKETFLLKNYLSKYWLNHKCEENKSHQKCLYLKDWHFVRAYPEAKIYRTPIFFCSDWLNEFWEKREDSQDDYRFVYLGPKGSWTPFHADVFQSYSWSANVCGRKKWIFFPPGAEESLKDCMGSLPYDIAKSGQNLDALGALTVIQEPGETIFVPSGWHHQVWNLEDTLSINHNWINATNILQVWRQLLAELLKVEDAISDCRSMEKWEDQCQLVLKASHGMDFIEYYHFLRAIAKPRIESLRSGSDLTVLDGHRQGRRHTEYDVQRLRDALLALLDDHHVGHLDTFESLAEPPAALLDQLNDLL